MRYFLTIFLALLFLCGACKEKKTADDDGEEIDVVEVEDELHDLVDIVEEDVAQDPDAVEDIVEDELQEEEAVHPSCADQGITCGLRTSGFVDVFHEENLDKYFINGRTLEFDESGGEFVFEFVSDSVYMARVEISDYSDGDLDIIILDEACDVNAAIAYGDSVVLFPTLEDSRYFIVVDGRDGSSGHFEIQLECIENFEICDNDVDDNGDGMVDCEDDQCEELPPCYELYCNDAADDDLDGDIDCDDFDCLGALSCVGGSGDIEEPCTSHADCQTGKCFMEEETGWPSGYCTEVSYIHNCDTVECPEGSHCEPLGFVTVTGPWVCARECSPDNPCREGYLCEDHLCFPSCTSASQCVETGYCHYDTGFCVTDPTEICFGGTDDDADSAIDCEDTDCMFRWECATPSPLEGGDTCTDAVALPLPGGERGTIVVAGTTAGASNDMTPDCEAIDSAEVIYSFTITAPARARIDLEGGKVEPRLQDTILSLKEDCEGSDLACNNDIAEGIYKHSYIEIELAAGTYYIVVDGFDGLAGDYNLGLNLSDI